MKKNGYEVEIEVTKFGTENERVQLIYHVEAIDEEFAKSEAINDAANDGFYVDEYEIISCVLFCELRNSWKNKFGFDYCVERLGEIGYRLDDASGLLYKENKEDGDYYFNANLIDDGDLDSACMFHILNA